MAKLNVKNGDTVQVVAGADKGKKGVVLSIDSNKLRIRVQGVRMKTHFTQEGLVEKEGFIDYSNIKFVSAGVKAKPQAKAKAKSAK